MSVCLEYRSLELIPRERVGQILKEAESFTASREWWAESFCFYKADNCEPTKGDWMGWVGDIICCLLGIRGEFLAGSFKLFLSSGYTDANDNWVEVDAEEDNLMAYLDARHAIEFLASCSKTLKTGWLLSCAGEPCGTIMPDGKVDQKLTEFLQSFTTTFTPFDPLASETVAAASHISAKYATRW